MSDPQADLDLPVSDVTGALRDLVGASSELTARLARRMEMHATDAQAIYLLDRADGMGVTELAGHLGMRGPSATVLVDRLVRAGLAVRERDPDDGRRVRVVATPAAVESSLATWRPGIEAIDDVGGALSPGERRVVQAYLERVRQVIDAIQ